MRSILFVELERFYVRALGVDDAEPVLVMNSDRVLDATLAALARGIRIGMSLSEARAIMPEAKRVEYLATDYAAAREAWLDLLVEVGNAIEPLEPHQAWVDLGLHPDPNYVVQSLKERMTVQGYQAKFGLSSVKWIAQVSAKYRPWNGEKHIEPHELLQTLPTKALTPVDPLHRERLEFLGYPTIGSVANAPIRVLKTQFGSAAFRIQEAAAGRLHEPVKAVYPEASISFERRFVDGLSNRLELDECLKVMAHRMSVRLAHDEKLGRHLVLVLEWEDGSLNTLRRQSPRALHSPSLILVSLGQMLLKQPFTQPLVRVKLIMPYLARRKQGQMGILSTMDLNAKARELEPVIFAVGDRFGDRAIRPASSIPELRRKRVLRVWREATGWL